MSRITKALCSKAGWTFQRFNRVTLLGVAILFGCPISIQRAVTQSGAHDPGVRGGSAGAGGFIAGLTQNQRVYFAAGLAEFSQVDSVKDGLGPRFNAESCAQCHAQPAIGGSSPLVNPQIAAATDQGATNQIPSFIASNGPVREARFPLTADLRQRDGGVHALFAISGRSDASGCNLKQPDFQGAANANNLVFRIPTPVFGGGLIEAIPDSTILAQVNAQTDAKRRMGIGGRPNRFTNANIAGTPNTSGNDGTVTRFGWKAQNKSLEIFSGEAYNVEMGVTNELFPNERDETPGCGFNPTPEDFTNVDMSGTDSASDIVKFAMFMRFLDQPQPAASTPSTQNGAKIFTQIGCALCHTPSMTTGPSPVAGLNNIPANLFSDLLLHHMGSGLADEIIQGQAQADEFRTAPLWGLGQRTYFLHDGRTSNLIRAILYHASDGGGRYPASEANAVIDKYRRLSDSDQQDLLNFLRSL
ncbi:MAG TPA: di-heme oxidoredictase family protein [Candidatus Sulfotelmatobacter sp.]|nr:di-heme oxidoredictase family protein [Candidatus Sulfotelmatobacter sp.]